VEHNYDGILFFDRERLVLYASPSYRQLIGYDPGEIEGRSGKLMVHPDDQPLTATLFQQALDNPGRPCGGEYRLRHKDGGWRTVESRIVNLLGDPLVQALVLNSRDVTERRRADGDLRASETRYRALFEHAINGIFQSTLDGRALAANPVFVRMLGYASEEELVSALVDLPRQLWAHPEERAEVAQAIAAHGYVRGYQCEFLRRDGTRFWISLNASAVRGADGHATYFLGSLEDITERKRAEGEQARLENQLQQAQRMESVGRLAGGVAHDFNNSLQLILLNAEMALGSPGVTPGSRRLLGDIQKTAQNAARLIAQLMAFARRQETHPQTLDLNDVTASYLPMLRRLVGEDVVIAWQPSATPCSVRLDPVQFEQVLINLATNARDAMGGNGRLTLATSSVTVGDAAENAPADVPPGAYVRLVVGDDGCGMSEEVLSHAFEPFFTTKPVGSGTGLGLASVFGIVTQNGGSIGVDSAPDQGTTITIQWPRHAAPASHVSEAPLAPATSRGGETLLVVEDEPMLLRACMACLEPLGYTVLSAALPSEALRAAERHAGPIHLLLTDVIMPEMNGRELADRLAALRPGLRRLYMSGHAAGVLSERGLADAHVQLLRKPFALDDLARAVRQALDETPGARGPQL
jgi:two-component system cell cycle sensor histidine kinase/response regulator CckA